MTQDSWNRLGFSLAFIILAIGGMYAFGYEPRPLETIFIGYLTGDLARIVWPPKPIPIDKDNDS